MRQQTSRHYARLLKTQKLLKERDESELAQLKRDLALLEEENTLLATMIAQGSYADFVDPLLISQRMERNRRVQARLMAAIGVQIKKWLQSNRRVERLVEKQIEAQAHESRRQLAEQLGEIIAHSFTSESIIEQALK